MDTTVIDCLVTQASRFKMFSFLTRGSALGLPQKLKLPIFNEKCVLQLSPLKKKHRQGKSASSDMHVPMIELNLHNITRYQKQRLYFHLTANVCKS